MNDTSIVMISYVSHGKKSRISVFSCDVTRASPLILSWSWSVPTSTASTCRISCARSICVKPPVDEPISSAVFHIKDPTQSSWKNPSSLPAERDTHSSSGAWEILNLSQSETSSEGFLHTLASIDTSPFSIKDFALFREYPYRSLMKRSRRIIFRVIRDRGSGCPVIAKYEAILSRRYRYKTASFLAVTDNTDNWYLIYQSFLSFYPLLYFLSDSREYFQSKDLEFWSLESREYPVTHCISCITTDADLESSEFICTKLSYERFDSILSSSASRWSVSDFCEVHIEIIDEDESIDFWVDLIEIHHLRHWFSWEIHVSCRLEEEYFFSIHAPLAYYPRESRIDPIRKSEKFSESINHQKPNIVSGIFVFASRITKSDDEFHRIVCHHGRRKDLLCKENKCLILQAWQKRNIEWIYSENLKSETKNLPWPRDNLFLKL